MMVPRDIVAFFDPLPDHPEWAGLIDRGPPGRRLGRALGPDGVLAVHARYDPHAARSRRPLHCPGRTGPELERRVLEVRDRWGWGPRKIHDYLSGQGLALPSARTGGSVLRRRCYWGKIGFERLDRKGDHYAVSPHVEFPEVPPALLRGPRGFPNENQ
jgi:hypothetical protein